MEILPKELTDQLDNETRAELGLLPLEKDLDAAEEIKKSKEYKLGYASGYAAGRSYKSRLLQPNIKHPEDTCENCGNENVTWFTSSDIWNAVSRRTDGTDPMLCPICFIQQAEEKGYNKAAWEIKPEGANIN
jgi:hypothetical protein